jgi:malate dehydrogenase (oxaloacetate-decarboxylating)
MKEKTFGEKSLEFHKKNGGKIGLYSKAPLASFEDLSIAYSPGVGEVSLAIAGKSSFDTELATPEEKAKMYTLKKNTVAIISDGSAILGLGNLGAYAAIPVMEGKAALLKEFAGVDAFPLCLATQDTEEIISLIKKIEPVFGAINLEDISAPRCFEIEERLRQELSIPVMHDDQWGTATVILAAVTNILKLKNKKKEDLKVVINGVGAAGVAISRLLISYGITDIIFCDSLGIISLDRQDLTKEKKELLENTLPHTRTGLLSEAVIGRDVFIGVSKAGVLSPEMIHTMAEKPSVLALANPIPEIMPEEAIKAGAFIVATGRSDYPNQLNNSLVFPGLFKKALLTGEQFSLETFQKTAIRLAGFIKNPTPEKILPSMFDEGLADFISERS